MKNSRSRFPTGCLAAGLLLFLGGTPADAQVGAPVVAPVSTPVDAPVSTPVSAQPAEDWRVEFEAVCATTDDSMSLTAEQLTNLIARCDKLVERIGAEEETVRRVYLRRLKMCRDLLAFVLESKNPAPASTR
jgi:hypothetical protein